MSNPTSLWLRISKAAKLANGMQLSASDVNLLNSMRQLLCFLIEKAASKLDINTSEARTGENHD